MLRPVEYVYLAISLAIVVQQLAVAGGTFDPVASGVALAFIGLIPAGRLDRRASDGGQESLLVRLLRAFAAENKGQ
jgi:hypothetical protein